MNFPLKFIDINLWLAFQTILLLLTSELISAKYNKTYILINKTKFRKSAIFVTTLFSVVIIIYLINILFLY